MKKTERNLEMKRLRTEEFWSYQEIADKFGVSRQRVYQILDALGCPRNAEIREEKIKQVYNFIVKYKQEHDGVSPSITELVSGCTRTSNAELIRVYVKILIKRGMLSKSSHGEMRSVEVIGGKWIPPITAYNSQPFLHGYEEIDRSNFIFPQETQFVPASD